MTTSQIVIPRECNALLTSIFNVTYFQFEAALKKRMEISEGAGSQVFIREGTVEETTTPPTSPPAVTPPKPSTTTVLSPINIEIPGVAKSVWQGSMFWKVPYNSNSVSRKRWFQVMRNENMGDALLTWSDPSKTKELPRQIKLSDVTAIKKGHSTAAFFNQVFS
jgi:hypothetical protein